MGKKRDELNWYMCTYIDAAILEMPFIAFINRIP